MHLQFRILLSLALGLGALGSVNANPDSGMTPSLPSQWRAEHLIIDLHQHVDYTTQHLARAIRIMDAVGVGLAVNLDGDTVTPGPNGAPSKFEQNKKLADTLYPGRFVHYMHLDYAGWDDPDWSTRAVQQIETGHRLGAAGLKEFKRLGLYLKDKSGKLLKVDDPKLDPVWQRCGELGLPISIHVADPKAFWLPYDEKNERWKELKDHRSWWFGDTNKFPAWKDLLGALDRVVGRHPQTTFVCVHFGNNSEELDWVDQALDRHPNMRVDLAARIPEIGRHDPAQVRKLFLKHQDRILFATDFMVYDKLILGSSGNEPPPSDADAEVFYAKEWRWLETRDKNWAHMTPIQGDWTISSIGLPPEVLRKVYFDNARKLLARSLPLPTLTARRLSQDFPLTGQLDAPVWQTARSARLEYATQNYAARPELATRVRALWSDRYLYLGYECPYTKVTAFTPPQTTGRRCHPDEVGASLWDRDVVEAFIGTDPTQPRRYAEFEVAPTNERLDLLITNLPEKDFNWTSQFESAVKVDTKARVWRCELRIPLTALSSTKVTNGTRWRLNLFRCDRAQRAFLAWSPTLGGSFHAPERFGTLELGE